MQELRNTALVTYHIIYGILSATHPVHRTYFFEELFQANTCKDSRRKKGEMRSRHPETLATIATQQNYRFCK
jgi:hypothetical protein